MANLTTRANVKTAHNLTDTAEDARIDLLLPEVDDYIQEYCGRSFFPGTGLAEYPNVPALGRVGCVFVDRPPITTLTSVHVSTSTPRVYDSTTLLVAGTDYIADLTNGIIEHQSEGFPGGMQAVKLVYDGGFATVPSAIQRAAVIIVGYFLFKGRDKTHHITSESRGDGSVSGYRFDIPSEAIALLDRYRLVRLAA